MIASVVNGCRFVAAFMRGGTAVVRVTAVLHISGETVLVIRVVGHDLSAAVGEGHAIFTIYSAVTILAFFLVEIRTYKIIK